MPPFDANRIQSTGFEDGAPSREDAARARAARAIELAAAMVEGTALHLDAEVADDIHEPLVAAALTKRACRDAEFARKLAGRHGTWVAPAPAIDPESWPDEAVIVGWLASRTLRAAGMGEDA